MAILFSFVPIFYDKDFLNSVPAKVYFTGMLNMSCGVPKHIL